MPLPEPSEQEGESVKAGQEPSPQSPEPGTDVVPTAPRKPRKFSKLVLLTASKDSDKVAAAKRKGVHCIMSLGVPGPTTLAKALLRSTPRPSVPSRQPPRSLSRNAGSWTQKEKKTEGWQGGLLPVPQWAGRSPLWGPARLRNPDNCRHGVLDGSVNLAVTSSAWGPAPTDFH
ncbi:hypothetical protein QTO34_013430 [Cnephaeus nilssonii]|uniref:FLYWCH-type zinc finger-containing protein N-terminal domain-containing protein n=1 Tax=Cnephaeus nilssonii TaxID=3371016 RepID=A0AA40LUV6_CNENI|nr:hypothetical protein QTO34_013430 [Eptesicus nilssonii]